VGIRLALVIGTVALFWVNASTAQTKTEAPAPPPAAAPQVFTEFAPDDLASIIRDGGYRAELIHENDHYRIRTGMGGYTCNAYLYCNADGKCTSLDWGLNFNPASMYTLTLANRFNREYRYAKAYLAANGTFTLEYSVDFAGGVTREAILQSAQRFENVASGLDSWVKKSQ
jgi:hypothetical protein